MQARDSFSSAAAGGSFIPVAVVDADGFFLQAALTNEKGYRKSVEQGKLWTLHPETGRLLPFRGLSTRQQEGYTLTLSRKGDWLTARLSPEAAADLPDRTEASAQQQTEEAAAEEDDSLETDFIAALWKLIENRKAEMPEGSYTSYLFSHGLDKIRKKTGEEAVELLLAREPDEVRHEAADLIYHMMVLLSAAGIDWSQIVAELKERHGP